MVINPTSIAAIGLRSLLKSASGKSSNVIALWLYTSFGMVRGSVEPEATGEFAEEGPDAELEGNGVIVIRDAMVEHYQSHLPTASFVRLYVRLDDVLGFALADEARQS